MMTTKKYTVPTVLSIAGFDGSGGAGIQADTKTISALGCYAMNVLTALPVQNTQGVRHIYEIPTQAVRDQLDAIFDDIYPDAIKIGMVHSLELVELISSFLKDYTGEIVFDPVMVSTSGHKLIHDDTIQACIDLLFPRVSLITPNLDEVSVLAKRPIDTIQEMEKAGFDLLNQDCQAVLIKGGHLQSKELTSLLFQQKQGVVAFTSPKIDTKNTHGSGCSLSSAIASQLAQQYPLDQAVAVALDYVHEAIKGSKDLIIGKGNGPLNHFHHPYKLIQHEMDQ
ncbi:bifunctional hydroxymethylpyrimidine kinase/phosphomethylpyrimidine kinase [Sphingobacterium sp. N143]|uniref:bifunctional hydroxymethylpyrimidine kinase/phosphomethylpyrimidine kinase n=1 Tax=Sphingobacterium sp. N143 TaxID=2746727 RepID=UPI002575BE03|nr:bifunctional hydroxymethylpyrimidine kinase/phosphomethylpyrimidine kinase [Sphingobacterium sp. N143]MDM1292795.1 bifunctional hydroxymethylpyrimidine kinase/phosphomethylpyrimidine kinase [Sphingobacterium sp. N143]